MEATVARALGERAAAAEVVRVGARGLRSPPGGISIQVVSCRETPPEDLAGLSLPKEGGWFVFLVDKRGASRMAASRPSFLYAGWTRLLERAGEPLGKVSPFLIRFAFSSSRSVFDLFLTQYARSMRGFYPERYVQEYARLGFTHIEVNALDGDHPLEEGVVGEFYPQFYTYAPALDQFASSRLNRGLYPEAVLKANRARLIENARLAVDYGLTPFLLCFEPRSVPESIFEKYPTLRGARVDHPFRSFKPRFNLSIAHPVVLEHYAELVIRLLESVPELGGLAVWSNDSGAGFEHTQSLYVGRNGGAYLIREWKSGEEIARAAAANVIRFLRRLRDAGRSINPGFRVLTRLEPFLDEREFIWEELGEGLDVEGNTLLARGWESPYRHPRYPELTVLGSAQHHRLEPAEKERRDQLAERGGESHFYHTFASHANHEPLLGIPFPWLTFEKLRSARSLGLPALAHVGGIQPPGQVPYAVNQEVFRRFQMDPDLDIETELAGIAGAWVGRTRADDLVESWRSIDEAVRSQPPMSLYSHFGVVWQRLLVRPLVPDIEAIPEGERAYYERHMCTSIHNPNRVDLAKDVLFELITPGYAAWAHPTFDFQVRPKLISARSRLERSARDARRRGAEKPAAVFEDQIWRVRALAALCETLRSTAVWIHAVHDYAAAGAEERIRLRALLADMISRETANARELLDIWENSPVSWLIVSGRGETPFIYGDNLGDNLRRKIDLMKRFGCSEPHVDPDFMFRVSNNPV